MRNILGLFGLCLIFACVQSGNKNASSDKSKACENGVAFGDVNICIPKVKGYQDARSFPNMEEQSRLIEANGNVVMGIFINDSADKQPSSGENLFYEDYYTIFSPQRLRGIRSNESNLKNTMRAALQNFSAEHWDSARNKIRQMTSGQLKVNKPVLVRTYSLNNKISSAIILMKVESGGKVNNIVFCMNMLLLKERIITMAYYINYIGIESIMKVKANSDAIALELQKANS